MGAEWGQIWNSASFQIPKKRLSEREIAPDCPGWKLIWIFNSNCACSFQQINLILILLMNLGLFSSLLKCRELNWCRSSILSSPEFISSLEISANWMIELAACRKLKLGIVSISFAIKKERRKQPFNERIKTWFFGLVQIFNPGYSMRQNRCRCFAASPSSFLLSA